MSRLFILLAVLALTACSDTAQLPVSAGIGPSPTLPPPSKSLVPTLKIAPAVGWKSGEAPLGFEGTTITRFAEGLDHPRWLHVLPNGDVLVAESNAPERPEEKKGLRAWVMGKVMKRAGAGVPSANRITLLRDTNADGVADVRTVFVDGLHSPFGMTAIREEFYVANTDAVVRYPYVDGATSIQGSGMTVVELPAGTRNHHWTKSLIASKDGERLYVTIGSNSNVAEHGMAEEEGRAAIWEIDRRTGSRRSFATGLRNPNGMDFEPTTGRLWTAVNERDEIGNDLVPDYITSVQDGGFYGWPYSYYGTHVDERVKPSRPDLVMTAIAPDYAVGSHTGSLGLAFSRGAPWPEAMRSGVFIGQHGSWNRKPPSGYKVIFVPFRDGKPSGDPLDVLTGFLDEKGNARGRPVGVAIDRVGALLVADDVGNVIWRVMPR